MTRFRTLLTLALLTIATAASAQTAAQQFDQLKSLAGTWVGKDSQGKAVTVSFRVTSGGSALMSEIDPGGSDDMITMFHLDGGRLLMTHYCHAGNQPRMQAGASADAKTIAFDYVDATNLTSSQPGHMEKLVIGMPDANHHTEQWSFDGHGNNMTVVFDLHRKA